MPSSGPSRSGFQEKTGIKARLVPDTEETKSAGLRRRPGAGGGLEAP